MREFHSFALSRSGHYAVLNWLAQQFDGCIFESHPPRRDKVIWNEVKDTTTHRQYVRIIGYDDMRLGTARAYIMQGKEVIVMARDPYNLWASLRYMGKRLDLDLWKEYAGLLCQQFKGWGMTFNGWFCDEGYRERVLRGMRIQVRDLANHRMSGASAFSGYLNRNCPGGLGVMSRWAQYVGEKGVHGDFKVLCNDVMVQRYCLEMFGWAVNGDLEVIS